jgi:hypothetical protein
MVRTGGAYHGEVSDDGEAPIYGPQPPDPADLLRPSASPLANYIDVQLAAGYVRHYAARVRCPWCGALWAEHDQEACDAKEASLTGLLNVPGVDLYVERPGST